MDRKYCGHRTAPACASTPHTAEIRLAEQFPFSHQHQRVRAFDTDVGILRKAQLAAGRRVPVALGDPAVAAGSQAWTCAPAANSASSSTRLGASRTSSVPGLKANPRSLRCAPVQSHRSADAAPRTTRSSAPRCAPALPAGWQAGIRPARRYGSVHARPWGSTSRHSRSRHR